MVNMNDDFGSYKDAIWKGLTAKELGGVMIAVFCCGGVSVVLYFMLQWNLYVSFLIGTAIAAAIIYSQVWKSKSGLSALEFYRARKYRKATAKLIWKCEEYNQARKEYLNNEYTPELAKADIERVKGKCDLIIVAMHWGTEYSMGVSDKQEEVANYLSSLGVNIIIGAHPHVVEPIEYINNGKTLVIYSLGDFISDQVGIERLTGLMVTLNVKKVVEKQISTVTVENVKGSLLYTKSNSYTPRNFRVYPYSQLNSTILPNYKSYYEKYKAVVTSRYPNLQFDEVSG